MTYNHTFQGTGVALVTPMNADGSISYADLEKTVHHVIEGGVDYLVALGTTGETSMLSLTEQQKVVDTILTTNNRRVPVVLGSLGGNSTRDQKQKLRETDMDGISGLLIASPHYVKPSQEGIYEHYKSLAGETDLPIIVYNVPSRTASNITWQTTAKLADSIPSIVAIKEATGDMIQTARIINNTPDDFQVLSGDDMTCIPLISCGGSGLISVIANLYPKQMSEIVHLAIANDYATANRINKSLYDLHHWLYIEGNPVGIKSAMQVAGICQNHVRQPLARMSSENYTLLEKCMETVPVS